MAHQTMRVNGVFGAEHDAAEDRSGHAGPCCRRRTMRRRTNVRAWILGAGAAALSAALAWSPAAPALGAPAIRARLVVGNLNVPTAFTFWPVAFSTYQIRIHDL